MNTKFIFKSILSVALIAAFLISCDKDYNNFGTDIIGQDNFDFDLDNTSTIIAYNVKTGPVQTNNLPIGSVANLVTVNPLGIYNNPVFGKTRASLVTQLQIGNDFLNPTFGANLVIDSVYVTVPYSSRKISTDSGGKSNYVLDSIYGSSKIKLSIFESGYFINDLDPEENLEETSKYYNNDQNFEAYRKGALADGTSVFNGPRLNNNDADGNVQNDNFIFSKNEIRTYTLKKNGDTTRTRTAPAMRIELNKNYFKKKIIEASSEKLSNNVTFKQYFRGLYFKVEQSDSDPTGNSLAMLDFTKGNVTIYYTEDNVKDGVTTQVQKTFVLNMAGNRLSLLEETDNATNSDYKAALASEGPDTPTGDKKLYLKGGEGAMTVIDLFGPDFHGEDGLTGEPNEVPDELDIIRKKGWLINEANLVFYVTDDMKENIPVPQRIYLYDLTNNTPLFDYSFDGTKSSKSVKNDKGVFGGIITTKTKNGKTYKVYKIRITRYINNIINNNADNVRLGLVVTESINDVRNVKLKTAVGDIDKTPLASSLNPLGTVLWGNTPEVDEDVKLKLEIYYTKPN